MSNPICTDPLLIDLSTQEQEVLAGGQAAGVLTPVEAVRGRRVTPIGRAREDGSETEFSNKTIRGVTNSGPFGSIGNSDGQGQGSKTGAEDTMILPPFFEISETL